MELKWIEIRVDEKGKNGLTGIKNGLKMDRNDMKMIKIWPKRDQKETQ